jgi:hypothetical protein
MCIDKVVSHPSVFPTIFYFQILEHGKAHFGSVKVWRILNPFGIFLNRFKTASAALCCQSLLSAPDAITASLPPLPSAHCRWPPGPTSPGPTCPPPAPASLAPRRPPLFIARPPRPCRPGPRRRTPGPLLCFSHPRGAEHPGTPTPPLRPPPPLQKEPAAVPRSPLFPPPLSPLPMAT